MAELLVVVAIVVLVLVARAASAPPKISAREVARRTQLVGYKATWLATRAEPEKVIAALGLKDVRALPLAEWNGRPPVAVVAFANGWTVVNDAVVTFFDDALADVMLGLARDVGEEVFGFATDRVTETHGWARASPDEVKRAFLYLAVEHRFPVDRGAPDEVERRLGPFTLEQPPYEGTVMELAKAWTFDPLTLDRTGARAFVADFPGLRERR